MYEFYNNYTRNKQLLHATRTGTRTGTRARLGLVAHARASARLAALARLLGAAFYEFDYFDFSPLNNFATMHFPRAAL